MRTVRRFLKRLTKPMAADAARLRAEIAEHLALQIEENLRAGLTPAEARRQALLKFGSPESMRESWHDERVLPSLDTLVQDTRHAVRRLRKSPAFTVAVVLTLALGIGATTSIFTLVDAVLLRSLPVANPRDLYRVGRTTHCCVWGGYTQSEEFSIFSHQLYQHLRDSTKGFEELAAFQAGGGALFGIRRAGTGEGARITLAEFVSGNYFTMFGLRPFAGRLLANSDDRSGAPPVAVMSYRLWQERYGAQPSIIGSTFNINQKPFTIVGITPPGFYGDTLTPSLPDFYMPLATEPMVQGASSLLNIPDSHWLHVIGRIRPGVAPASLEAELRVELKQWIRSHWSDMDQNARRDFDRQTLFLSPGGGGITSMREQFEHWLNMLMIVTASVLLIVCANIANLMLVRGIERRQQISLSIALGARTSRLVREAITESLLLSLAGGALGLLVAFAGTRLILHSALPSFSGFAAAPIPAAPSLAVLAFAFGVSLLTGLIFGAAPAWMAARVDPIEALRGAGRSTRHSGSLARGTLVVLQAALSLALLCTSGLLVSVLRTLENQDFGFQQDRRMVVGVDAQLAGYRVEQLDPLYQRIEESVSGIPGVASVALCLYSPLDGADWNDAVVIDGRPPQPADARFDRVTAGYFDVIGNPIVRGRGITDRDTQSAPHVAVINEAFARKYFPNENPIGKYFGRADPSDSRQYQIVGIAKDARYITDSLDRPIGPMFFVPAVQYDSFSKPERTKADLRTHFLHNVVIVTRPGAHVSDTDLRRAIASVDANLPVFRVQNLHEQIAGQFMQQRLIARLTSFFGVLSLLLAAIGLYGVTAYNAERRTSEIGVRMALGADRGRVIALVLRGALGLIAVGLVLGLPLTWAAGRLLGNLLYGTDPANPVVIGTALASLGLSGLIAALIPALRASAISPVDALRTE